ncbi:HN1_G0034230.mRNA.1.CDS.1 [Saccharomyces cerevisiae]|nr:HN1_G0034230.mRNA.1.CDS.1 [Saccharomyces cerevisiae]
MESVFLHNNIAIISFSVLYITLSYYSINPCILASIKFSDCFSIFIFYEIASTREYYRKNEELILVSSVGRAFGF